MTHFLMYERVVNVVLGVLATILIGSRARSAVAEFGRKRVARYFGYLGFAFVYAEGGVESSAQSAPVGVKTVLGTLILLFVIYSEWPPRTKGTRT